MTVVASSLCSGSRMVYMRHSIVRLTLLYQGNKFRGKSSSNTKFSTFIKSRLHNNDIDHCVVLIKYMVILSCNNAGKNFRFEPFSRDL